MLNYRLRFQSTSIADETNSIEIRQADNAAEEARELIFRLMPADVISAIQSQNTQVRFAPWRLLSTAAGPVRFLLTGNLLGKLFRISLKRRNTATQPVRHYYFTPTTIRR